MEPLHIQLFGTLRLLRGGETLEEFATDRCRRLFSYVAVNYRRRHSRAVMMGTFWGDLPEAIARKRLRTCIWRIRQVVEGDGVPKGTVLEATSTIVGLNLNGVASLDIAEFESALRSPPGKSTSAADEIAALERAVALYRGDLLEEIYDDWSVLERARLKAMLLDGLQRLIAHRASARDWENAIVHARDLLSRDPLREQSHRVLMCLYYLRGDRPAALRHFRVAEETLRRELGVEPMAATRRLVDAIQQDDASAVRAGFHADDPMPPPPADTPSSPPSMLKELIQVRGELDRVRAQVERTIERLQDER